MKFIYGGYRVEEGLEGTQYLVFEIKIKRSKSEYLARLLNCKFDVILSELFERGCRKLGKLVAFSSGTPSKWIDNKSEGEVECWIQVTPILVDKLHEILSNDYQARFDIKVHCEVEWYDMPDDIRNLKLPKSKHTFEQVCSFRPDGSERDYILFTTDELKGLIEELKHFEFIRIGIPVCRERAQLLEGAVKQIENAMRNFKEGKFREALLDTRNALTNNLMELKEENEKRRWVLREEIRGEFLRKSPSDMREVYEDVLNRVEDTLRNQLRIINDCFIHKDSDRLRHSPMREDVQNLILIVATVIDYLSRRILS